MQLTFEQGAVVAAPDRNLIVKAFAGSGKTATLVQYARARPDELMLYLAFNKAVQIEATSRFPPNVHCRTTHSLAYAGFGARYAAKLRQPRPWEVSRAFKCPVIKAQHALETVIAWCCSGDDAITIEHRKSGMGATHVHIWSIRVSPAPNTASRIACAGRSCVAPIH